MNVNAIELFEFFDELMSLTNEEQGVYWLSSKRDDGITIIVTFSLYESSTSIIIENDANIGISSLNLNNCSEIRVLDQKRKCLEVLHNDGSGRCFLALLSDTILEYSG